MWFYLLGQGPGSETRTYSSVHELDFGAHLLWQDTMFSLGRGMRGLVLPQLGIPEVVDSSREVLLILKCGLGM